MKQREQAPTEKLLWKYFLDSLRNISKKEKSFTFALFIRQNQNENSDVVIASSFDVPINSFKNAKKESFIRFIEYVLVHTKSQHGITINRKDYPDIFELVKNKSQRYRVICFSSIQGHYNYIMIVVTESSISDNDDYFPVVKNSFPFFKDYLRLKIEQEEIDSKLQATKLFICELGHDMATQIQSIGSKLRIISYQLSGDSENEFLKQKADEARMDLLNAYSLTDSLEITINDEYTLRSENWFSLSTALNEVSTSLESEAREKEVVIDIKYSKEKIQDFSILGDKRAFKLCAQHILMNAIKYSHPSRTVEIFCSLEKDRLVISISNYSMIKLPSESERLDIYKFGKRTAQAKKLHVNGSGMGLYTAKRIILAHGGTIWEKMDANARITFSISIPKDKIEQKPMKGIEKDTTIIHPSY